MSAAWGRRAWARASTVAVLLLGSISSSVSCAPPGTTSGAAAPLPPSDHPLSGAPAPAFNLSALSGSAASLEAYAGRIVLLDFWATWCDPCKLSFPEYQALSAQYGDSLAIVAISEDDESDGIDAFVRETGATFPVAWDGDKAVAERYQISGMPTLFIIDKSGLVRFVHSGFRPGDEAQIKATIDSLM
jgi:thiol-disulfide isomerase/thioredoxin